MWSVIEMIFNLKKNKKKAYCMQCFGKDIYDRLFLIFLEPTGKN